MGTKRRSFSKEFKLEAVRLVIEVGDSIARVSRDLGIRSALLGRWKQEYEEDQGNAFPGKGQLKPGDELQQLRRENARLRMERDILKKAAVIFVMSSSFVFMPRRGTRRVPNEISVYTGSSRSISGKPDVPGSGSGTKWVLCLAEPPREPEEP